MNRVSIDRHGSLAHNLREAWVSVYGHPHLLRCPLDQLGEDALGDADFQPSLRAETNS